LFAAASYAVQIGGAALLLMADGTNVPLLLLGVALFGAGIGNATSLPPLVAQGEFAKEDVQRVVSLIVALAQASNAFAPAAFGVLRVMTPESAASADGAAPLLFAAAATVQALALGCFLVGRAAPPVQPPGHGNVSL